MELTLVLRPLASQSRTTHVKCTFCWGFCLCAWFFSWSPTWFPCGTFGFLQGPLYFEFSFLMIGWGTGCLQRLLVCEWRSKKILGHWCLTFPDSAPSSGCDLIGLGTAWALGVVSPLDIPGCHRVGELCRNLCCVCLTGWVPSVVFCAYGSALSCAQEPQGSPWVRPCHSVGMWQHLLNSVVVLASILLRPGVPSCDPCGLEGARPVESCFYQAGPVWALFGVQKQSWKGTSWWHAHHIKTWSCFCFWTNFALLTKPTKIQALLGSVSQTHQPPSWLCLCRLSVVPWQRVMQAPKGHKS